MRWSELKSIGEIVRIDKLLHKSGLSCAWSRYLTNNEMEDIQWLYGILSQVANIRNDSLRLLMVGSAVDGCHIDIDLLCYSTKDGSRRDFAKEAIESIYRNDHLCTMERRFGVDNGIIVPAYIAIITAFNHTYIDLKFSDDRSGDFHDILSFHKRVNLSHAIVV